ncbi:MAG: hypothetical protein HKO59_05570, partial [Phycisphaerales bacterium]|nr:hypothetical protein [Phycisphaerales bacterium]
MSDRVSFRFAVRGALAACLIGGATHAVTADTIRLHGSTLALPECTVQDMRTGRLYYADPRGRRQYRDLDDIAEITFTDLPSLAVAEQTLATDSDAGLHAMLSSLLEARSDVQRLWIRRRLVHIHDARGEYVQAASHLGALCVLREDPAWRHLVPMSAPNRPSFEAAREAVTVLHAARRRIRHRALQDVLDRLLRVIQPIHDGLALEYTGTPPAAGTTLSGVSVDTLRRGHRDPPSTSAPPPSPPPVVHEPPATRT